MKSKNIKNVAYILLDEETWFVLGTGIKENKSIVFKNFLNFVFFLFSN